MEFTLFKPSSGNGRTKIQHLVNSIAEAIQSGELKEGDFLPSVNQLNQITGFSRDTVFKAYRILKRRNLVESAPAKGYFISGKSFKILMLLDDFSAFKEQLYQSFRNNLSSNYSVDLLFHHYNKEIFKQLIQNSTGRYNAYIVMNIDHEGIDPVLERIDPNKLLVLDIGNPKNKNLNYLVQDFHDSVISCLTIGLQQIKKYKHLVLVYSAQTTPHPAETVSAVQTFCSDNKIVFQKVNSIKSHEIASGQVYFVIRDADLVEVIKLCRDKNLVVGRDVGVISYNDTPMKQIVGGGITVISTDFEQMGQKAADFVKTKQKTAEILQTSLILRESL